MDRRPVTDDAGKGCADCTDWGNSNCTEGCRPHAAVHPAERGDHTVSDYSRRERVEYVLPTPANAAQLDKAVAALIKEFGSGYGDDTFVVTVEGDSLVLSFTR